MANKTFQHFMYNYLALIIKTYDPIRNYNAISLQKKVNLF